MKLKVNTVTLAEGPLFETHHPETGEIETAFYYSVVVPDDRDPDITWIHPHAFREYDRQKAARFASKVLARGVIETDRWVEHNAQDEMTLEERFELYAHEEAVERARGGP
jgi:hypothetical protein